MAMSQAHTTRAVLFLTHQLNLGGVSTHMHALGRGLIERGVRVGIVAREMNDGKPFGRQYFESAGIMTIQCDFPLYGLAPSNIRKAVRSVRRIRKIVNDFDADVLHVHAPTLCLSARFSGRPYVTTFHLAVTGKNKIRLARLVNRVSPGGLGAYCIAISKEMAANLQNNLHVPADRVRRVTLTVDDAAFQPATDAERTAARQAYRVDDAAMVVCMVASLEERKNHALLLDAVRLARGRVPGLRVLLAGSGWGDHESRLMSAIAERGVGDIVQFLGQQPAKQVYQASDVFVLPSLQEGFPLTTIEAMFCGLVPVRTPSEGADEQIRDGETGYIVPFAPADVLADRLVALATDAALRKRLAAAALADAGERFRLGRMADETLALYDAAVRR